MSNNLFERVDNESFHMANQWEVGIKRTLNLANCRLSSIRVGSLTKLPDLNDLDLSGNPAIPPSELIAAIKELEHQRFQRLSVAAMNLTDIQSFFTQVTLLALKFLNASHNQISDVPQGMFSTIRSLRVLDLSYNKLPHLGEGISDLVNLRALNLSNNDLTTFQGQAVSNLDKVKDLDISNNKLHSKDKVNLRTMIKLQRLIVNNNLLPIVVLPRTTNNLVHLDYSSNSIRRFKGFYSVPKLEHFDVSDNDIEKVEEFLFKDSHVVKLANFSGNSIKELDPRAFLPQSPLKIDLSHNFISKVQYSNWVATQELYLKDNQIDDVDMQTFHLMTGLRVLDLSENNITSLHEDLLKHTSAIQYLNLSHNSLTQAHFEMLLRQVRDLKTLDLGYNNISHLNESMMEPIPMLERIYVRNNRLEIVMPRVFRDLKYIKEIDLSDNPFLCVCDMLAFKDWLLRTSIQITGLYTVNSTAYTCRGPASRIGEHVMKWEPGKFECDEVMLYMIVFGSIGLTLIVAGIISTVAHRLYLRHKRKKQKRLHTKKELETIEKMNDSSNKKLRMSSEEIAEDFTNAIERMEQRSMRKNEESKRKGNGYVPWPSGKKEKSKEKDRGKNVDNTDYQPTRREEAAQVRAAERYYDHLTRTDGARIEMETARKKRDQGERNREGKRDRSVEHIDIDGGVIRMRTDNRNGHRFHERGPYYDDHDRAYRTNHMHPSSRDLSALSPARAPPLGPRNRWDNVEVWDRDARGWVIPGHRRSRSQGHRRDRDDQRYLTMPIRDQDYHPRSRSPERGGGRKPAIYLDHYTNEVRYGIEDLNRYPGDQRKSRRDLHEGRSKSYHQLPMEYRTLEGGRQAPFRHQREAREQRGGSYLERQKPEERHPPHHIGMRTVSQPYLANEGGSGWL